MKYLICLLFSSFLFLQCTSETAPVTKEETKPASSQLPKPKNQEKAKSTYPKVFAKRVLAGKVNFDVSAENGPTSNIHIKCDDLAVRKFNKDLTVDGHLKHAFGLDLNKDGFHELYLVVEKNEPEGWLEIIGFASYNDKSAGEITIRDLEIPRKENSDKVYAFYEELRREYYGTDGVIQVYTYKLKKEEAGYALEPYRTK